jgi:hypothetical protein
VSNATEPAPRRATHVTCTQFIFRTKSESCYPLATVLQVLHVGGLWKREQERDAVEARMRRGEVLETKAARYQVIAEHIEGAAP